MTIQQLCRENQIYKLKVIQLTKERQMLECDYNARLKADMVAILEVIKLRIDNLPEPLNRDRVNYCIQQKINELPSVTPQEPRKGHWIIPKGDVKPFGDDTIQCDMCGFFTDVDCNYNFCPNCGAKMVEPQESEVEDENDD